MSSIRTSIRTISLATRRSPTIIPNSSATPACRMRCDGGPELPQRTAARPGRRRAAECDRDADAFGRHHRRVRSGRTSSEPPRLADRTYGHRSHGVRQREPNAVARRSGFSSGMCRSSTATCVVSSPRSKKSRLCARTSLFPGMAAHSPGRRRSCPKSGTSAAFWPTCARRSRQTARWPKPSQSSMADADQWLLFDQFHRRNVTAAYAELEWDD